MTGESEIVVPGVPVELFLESQDQQADLIRELKIIDLGEQYRLVDGNIPRRLAALISEILSAWHDVRTTTRQQALAARDAGWDHVDLTIPVRPGLADALRRWLDLLTEADRLSDEGYLLSLASRPEIRNLRAQYVEDICRQLS